jgi:hypothetical protein
LWKKEPSVENTQNHIQFSAASGGNLNSKLARRAKDKVAGGGPSWQAGRREKALQKGGPGRMSRESPAAGEEASSVRPRQEFATVLPRSLKVCCIEQYP